MRYLFITLFVLLTSPLLAQDTLRLNLRQADSLFVKNNLLLLAERYRIEASRAYELQAGLWENPNLLIEASSFNNVRSRVLDVGRQGQKIIAVQQLLYTAGKRNKRLALAVEATHMTELEFHDLLRTLKFELRERFYESYFLRNTVRRIDSQIVTLQSTVEAFEREYNRNNISLKEVLRLKALLFQLNNDRADIQYELADNQLQLRNLLQLDNPIEPTVDTVRLRRYQLTRIDAANLYDKATQSRADLKIAQSLTRQSELNYSLQKSLAVPDVRIGATYDQAGSYINNYLGLSVSADLPVFNKNQGNIRAARSQIRYQKVYETARQNSLRYEVDAALQKVREAERVYGSIENRFMQQFELLNKGIYENFQKRNISLLEFIDFIESYNESIKEFNRLQANRIRVYEELSYVVGEELFN
ncbi:TolC family protein [Telluribacter sp. SYSU D00476]|uniref:TolC family protein n=1 Tax=Telluribacter sp. SYSU D00476 TaxID=2811430 RepID=UPI001FF62DAC|nr:TolC family protein [Telluribacter sp. SYSU D00476]